MRRRTDHHNTSWADLHKFRVKFPYAEGPDNYNIDDLVKIGEGTELWPHIILDGKIVIGKNCKIGRGVVIIGDIIIGDNVSVGHNVEITGKGYIGDNSVIKHDIYDPMIGSDCLIEGRVVESKIGDRCEVGEFAEIKRSDLGWGVKAKHSCGIRDATIGCLTNIASGTDIKNWDGIEKSKTVIGSKCFIAGQICGGVNIGNEVRIHPEMLVKINLPDFSYYSYSVKEDRSWYLEGFYLNLKFPIPGGNRNAFITKTENKLGYKFNHGLKPMDKNLSTWLNTPLRHLGGLSPLRALEKFGCPAISCILGECGHFSKIKKNPG